MARIFYLSRVFLKMKRRDPYPIHQALWKAFPNITRGEEQPFLFRHESHHDGKNGMALLVQSRVRPEWKHVDGLTVVSAPVQLPLAFKNGMRFNFLCQACPNRKKMSKERYKQLLAEGKHRTPYGEWAERWLFKQAELAGFGLILHEIQLSSQIIGKRKETDKETARQGYRLPIALIQGELVVTDEHLFNTSILNGVGPKKAYGYGLLSLLPA